MKEFKFVILTQDGKVFDDLVSKVVVTTSDGEITILKDHIPLITTTNKGRLIIFKNEDKIEYEVSDGVLKVNNEETTLMSYEITKK